MHDLVHGHQCPQELLCIFLAGDVRHQPPLAQIFEVNVISVPVVFGMPGIRMPRSALLHVILI